MPGKQTGKPHMNMLNPGDAADLTLKACKMQAAMQKQCGDARRVGQFGLCHNTNPKGLCAMPHVSLQSNSESISTGSRYTCVGM